MSLYLGIDSGTQSTKCVACDLETGRVVATARAPHTLIAGLPPGHLEQDPKEWMTAMETVIADVAARLDSRRVRGIGVSGQQHGFVPLDAGGAVIRPAKLWCDTSTVEECARLTRKLGGPRAVVAKAGLPFLPGYTAPKILWLKRHEPAHYRRLRHVLLPHDYLNFHLTGNYRMEYGDASGTALMDVRRRVWSRPVLAAIDPNLAEWLPPLSSSAEPAGTLRPELAEKLGLPPDVLVSAGGGDNMMGAIGTGNVSPGTITASFGTSGTIYAFSRTPVVDPRGEIAAFCSSTGGWLPLLCTMNVTGVTEQTRALFGWSHADLEREIASAPPAADGLTLLPYFTGERTPNLPHATGVLYGLNPATFTPAHLARAAMEGVTLGMYFGLRRLAGLGIKANAVRVTGGGSKSAVWRQITADIFGLPVVAMAVDEGAALGAAIQAAWCDALRSNRRAALAAVADRFVQVDESTRCTPDRDRHRLYQQAQARHESLTRLLFEK